VALGTIVNDQMAVPMLIQLLQDGETFVDIGSHIGSVIASVLHERPNSPVIAFEAIPEKADYLRRRFPKVAVHCCALSEEEGEASFYITDQSGYSSLAKVPGKEIKVSTCRLDDVLANERVHAMKIDVEGAELGVLRGAEEVVATSRPVIMFESGPGNVLGYTKEALFDWFASREYGIMAPNRLAHTGGPMTSESFADSHEYPRRTTNYFAVPMEQFDEVRRRAAIH
jgi:FkbM family methyltransferase